MKTYRNLACLAGVLLTGLAGGAAFAAAGHPESGQIGFQAPVTEVARDIQFFHNDILMPIITVISLFVLGLLIYVGVKFSEKANPVLRSGSWRVSARRT